MEALSQDPRWFVHRRLSYQPDKAAKVLDVSESTLANWRKQGIGPAWVKAGGRLVLYTHDALVEWLQKGRAAA